MVRFSVWSKNKEYKTPVTQCLHTAPCNLNNTVIAPCLTYKYIFIFLKGNLASLVWHWVKMDTSSLHSERITAGWDGSLILWSRLICTFLNQHAALQWHINRHQSWVYNLHSISICKWLIMQSVSVGAYQGDEGWRVRINFEDPFSQITENRNILR